MKVRELRIDEVAFQIQYLDEDESVYSALEVPSQIHWVNTELERGNAAAWFCAKMTAIYKGFIGVDYLGCCSYESFSDFENDAYYKQMKENALDDLNATIRLAIKDLEELEVA